MKFIEEVVVDEFLPTVRSMLAEDLRERGFTQREVADALGISQSAVSKYAHGDVARNDRVVADERVRDLVDRVGEGLAAGEMTPVAALVEIEVLIRRLEEGDLLAELHEEAMPALAAADVEFSVHDPDSGLRERESVLASVRRGLRTLTNASGFAALIPNVGANVVECLADARTIDDVAAVPGRLVDVKGRAMVPGEPEFGVSEHVATVLLAAREGGALVRGAVNVRYDPETVAALGESHPTVAFDPERPTREAVAEAVAEADRDGDAPGPDALVLYQTGAVGIEPIVYVLAPTAADAAEIVRGLL
ncbi:helix-turn-helix domain-containing protein [Halorubrum sp. CBA1125]|uniref:thiamine-phosphate synthase family protein n=1 Tax=Halorubrum sp. CBA1125 TaxID=2668072 RepID=UPI0012E8F1A8|nr:thiamine-phosphate synthase family protein [Halorubrum sp. CBA1125]MUW15673.1 helix-turn-helix domain-containing protein [Halorubrum sp. CBA1125]